MENIEWPEGTKIINHKLGPKEISLPEKGVNLNEFSREQLRVRKKETKPFSGAGNIQPAQGGKTYFNAEAYNAKLNRKVSNKGESHYKPTHQDDIRGLRRRTET